MDIHFPMQRKDIEALLPHRDPFRFVDRVLEIDNSGRIVAEKDVLADEWYFRGHFPDMPLVPGVIVSEALAQASGLLVALTKLLAGSTEELPMLFLAGVNMKYQHSVFPGDTLRLLSGLKREFGGISLFDVQALVKGQPVGRGTVTLAAKAESSKDG